MQFGPTGAGGLVDMQTLLGYYLGEDTPANFSLALRKAFLNMSLLEMYTEIVQQNEDYFATSTTISLVAGTELYTLPLNSRILYVERVDQAGVAIPLKGVNLTQRWAYLSGSLNLNSDLVYYIAGNQIGFLPVPSQAAANSIRIWHIPPATQLSADADKPPLEWSADHHEVIVVGAFMRAMVRDKDSYEFYKPTFKRLHDSLLAATAVRDTNEPQMVVETDGG